MGNTFLAIDFETANQHPHSACSIGIVKVKNGKIVKQKVYLIRPPEKRFMFTYIHGITWGQVSKEPLFDEVWQKICKEFDDVDFIAAHNASFDGRVLKACCDYYGIDMPDKRFVCTVQLARSAWNIRPTKLPNVCDHLGIKLNHHEALSDATACAQIVIHAINDGINI